MVVKMYIKYSITNRTFWISIAEIIVHKMFHCSNKCTLNIRLQKKMNIKCSFDEEEFEDTKGVIRILISKKDRQHSGQKKNYKRTNNDLQNITLKLE